MLGSGNRAIVRLFFLLILVCQTFNLSDTPRGGLARVVCISCVGYVIQPYLV